MKEGDLIRTSWHIPDIPIVPPAGDSYPLGAISPGTKVCLVQKYPDSDEVMFYNEGTSAKVMRKVSTMVHGHMLCGYEAPESLYLKSNNFIYLCIKSKETL